MIVKCLSHRFNPLRMAVFTRGAWHWQDGRSSLFYWGSHPCSQPLPHIVFLQPRSLWIMNTKPQQPKERGGTLSSLNVAIQTLNLAKEISSVTPAKAVFGSVSVLLTMIRVRFLPAIRCSEFIRSQDSMENELEYVELGLSCADICKSPDRGMHGRRLEDFSRSVSDAINQLTT